jgi:tRNA nucleotidyltransferase (CCA-adding enzyme)
MRREKEKKQNISNFMRERLPKRIFSFLKEVGDLASERNDSVFAVGGFVRDLILEKTGNGEKNHRNYESLDIDIVVEGNGVEFAQKFALKRNCELVIVHDRFGTATLKLSGGVKVDFATARKEIYSYSGSLPLVQKGSIKDDLYRRDFTINAIAIKLDAEQFAELFDPFDGIADLKRKILRVMHDMSFIDDPTRIFRGVRFEKRYDFHFEPQTENLMNSALSSDVISNISGHRLKNELLLILKEAEPAKPLKRLWELGIFKYVHESLKWRDEMETDLSEIKRWLLWWKKNLPRQRQEPALVRLPALFKGLDSAQIQQVSDKLSLDGKTVRGLRDAKSVISSACRLSEPIAPSQTYELLNSKVNEALLFLVATFKNEILRKNVINYVLKIRDIRPLVDGNLLKALGYLPGPIYSEILREAFKAQVDGKIHNKSQAVAFVKRRFQ